MVPPSTLHPYSSSDARVQKRKAAVDRDQDYEPRRGSALSQNQETARIQTLTLVASQINSNCETNRTRDGGSMALRNRNRGKNKVLMGTTQMTSLLKNVNFFKAEKHLLNQKGIKYQQTKKKAQAMH